MKNNSLLKKVALPLVGGMIIGYMANRSTDDEQTREQYEQLKQPPLSPPGAVFPIVWTTLYTSMGIAHYLLNEQKHVKKENTHYYQQLTLNFAWPLLFFKYKKRGLAALESVPLFLAATQTARQFYQRDKLAGALLVPYAAWTGFAMYLSIGTWALNRNK